MSSATKNGFTLVELLVVMAIISVLAALLTPALIAARRHAEKKDCENIIKGMDLSLSGYLNDFGDYPPTDLELEYGEEFGVVTNGINSGIESLVAHLYTTNQSGPYPNVDEDWLGNCDEDSLNSGELRLHLNWQFGNDALREFVDPWGNPLVYFHSRDYAREFQVQEQLGEGGTETGSVTGAYSEMMATYNAPTGYQLWSLGPDGKSQFGTDNKEDESDDIGSW